jgi:hypothetical protein
MSYGTGETGGFGAEPEVECVSQERPSASRLLQGEPLDAVSRELGVGMYRLDGWRNQALRGMESGLKKRGPRPAISDLEGSAFCGDGAHAHEAQWALRTGEGR